ncbi:type IV toxin-antitoxin system AbiEi family antitoxin [Mycobacterium montefiorense]|uniref:type IV toxin-antitoxin system AbiEi family antitoxin n=1 Tax=Mycobacterium montefiorense TaxID=154654 RepID=UPI0021C3B89D|nr:type IV toxin-antitoxin system AbiEi family antitoxin [Mycobacterium montefiorense]
MSAAAVHGAAHQAPQVFQVAVHRHVRDRAVGRTKFRFAMRDNVTVVPTERRTTRSGSLVVSTREVTMLDIATDITRAGGLNNAATVLVELADEGFDSAALVELSALFPAAAGRRIGWILKNVGKRDGLEPLHAVVAARPAAASQLSPTGPTTGNTDHRWALRLNAEVEADI